MFIAVKLNSELSFSSEQKTANTSNEKIKIIFAKAVDHIKTKNGNLAWRLKK